MHSCENNDQVLTNAVQVNHQNLNQLHALTDDLRCVLEIFSAKGSQSGMDTQNDQNGSQRYQVSIKFTRKTEVGTLRGVVEKESQSALQTGVSVWSRLARNLCNFKQQVWVP